MKHLGDISKIHGAQIEPVDLITFGSPCQDLSVAGKRAGLKHEVNGDEETTRSGLFMEAVRIIKEMREATNGKYPRFALWENVPGAFSSNKGEDFRVVLEEIAKIAEADALMPEVPKAGWAYADCFSGDGWSMAYRVLDAQHWGVPQRRRRIFLVADFAGERAEEILFEREGLRGDFAPGGTPWQGAAADAKSSTGAESGEGKCYGVTTKGNGDAFISEERHSSLTIGGGQAGQGYPCILSAESEGKCYGISSYASNAMMSDNPHSGIYEANTSRTLDLNGGNPACNQGGIAVVEPVDIFDRLIETPAPELTAKLDSDGNLICMATQQGGAEVREDDKSPTLTAAAGLSGNNQPCVVTATDIGFFNSMENTSPSLLARGYKDPHLISHPSLASGNDVTGCLMASGYDKLGAQEMFSGDYTVVEPQYIVRRLTPIECARLQGFADNWGQIDEKESFTEEEYRFWLGVRNTHAAINGKQVKDYTEKQMLTWYNKLHTDSAEYKMWGNGIALPPALYVMQGIAEAIEEARKTA